MIRRPMWLGAGVVLGVGGTLWAEQHVRRRVRRAVELLSPSVARSEAVHAARQVGGRVRDAVEVAREERSRQEAELWRRLGEIPALHGRPNGRATPTRAASPGTGPKGSRRQHR